MYRLFFALSFVILFAACNSDDNSATPQEPENFFALEVGNSWEYEVFQYSSQTEEFELKDLLINTEITSTSEINGETYYNFTTTSSGSFSCGNCVLQIDLETVRDSIGYLVNPNGAIAYSRESQEDYLVTEQNWGSIFGVLQPNTVDVTTSAGSFSASQNDRYVILPDGTTALGRDRELMADRIGFILKSISFVNQSTPLYEMRLKSYSLVQE